MDGYLVSIDGSCVPASRDATEHALSDGRLLWLDLHLAGGHLAGAHGASDQGADEDALAMLREVFAFHPVALDDVAEFGQRPKAESFGDVVYIVGYAATAVLADLVEVHAFYSERFLITVRKKGCDSLDAVRNRLTSSGGLPVNGNRPIRLLMLHNIVDGMIDSFFPPLSDLDDRIDHLQERIFAAPSQEELSDLLGMQGWLVGVRKMVTPQRDVMAALLGGVVELPGRTADTDPYLRDLYDHVIRISDLIDSYRDLLSNSMDAYLSMVSNKLNEVMKQLAVIATVFLPLSFLTGFFGQNFAWLVAHLGGLANFLILGIGTEALAVVGLVLLFRRRGWI